LVEPVLVLTPPKTGTEEDNGFLTASEVATLKLKADLVTRPFNPPECPSRVQAVSKREVC